MNAEHAFRVGRIEGEAAKRPSRSKARTILVPLRAQGERIAPVVLRFANPSDEVVPAIRACRSPKIETPPQVRAVRDRRAQRQIGNRRVAFSKTQL